MQMPTCIFVMQRPKTRVFSRGHSNNYHYFQAIYVNKEGISYHNHTISRSVAIEVYQIRMHIHAQVASNCFPHQFMVIVTSYFDCFIACFSCTVKQQLGGGGGNSLYMTWYGCAARIAPFFSTARYTISPLFPRKLYMTDPFFLGWYMNGPIFHVPV